MSRVVKADKGETFDIELSEDLLKANEALAKENKKIFRKHDIKVIDVMGSVGTGKTSLIEQIVQKLKGKYRIAAIAGDLTTTIDSDRIGRYGVDVVQINTGKECHLDANLVKKALKKIDLDKTNLIIIENVGNLICPAEFHLGSDKRVVVISLSEGPNMIIKHPYTFMEADVIVINKMDLEKALDADVVKLVRDAQHINPKAKIVKTSCKNSMGIDNVIEALNL